MPRTKPRRELTEQQLQHLAGIICTDGGSGSDKADALLVLMDEIQNCAQNTYVEEIADTVKRYAFTSWPDDVMQAQVQLLRGELT
ncbi:MAG TPA: hypothetical protein VMZ30_02075 [Pyrinomonadaceae bacterium]|nr:hypothetical protein [Pyrinomonadaceae bacterium]